MSGSDGNSLLDGSCQARHLLHNSTSTVREDRLCGGVSLRTDLGPNRMFGNQDLSLRWSTTTKPHRNFLREPELKRRGLRTQPEDFLHGIYTEKKQYSLEIVQLIACCRLKPMINVFVVPSRSPDLQVDRWNCHRDE